MANEVSVYNEDYFIEYFSSEKPVKIDEQQFDNLEKALLDTDVKFIKIGDNIINASAIKQVTKVKAKKFPYTN